MRWECGNPAFFAGFPRTVGREGNGFMFSSLSIRPSFPPLKYFARKFISLLSLRYLTVDAEERNGKRGTLLPMDVSR